MYFLCEFYYPGPRAGVFCGQGGAIVRALEKAERKVEAALRQGNLRFAHAYSLPDGSLSKYIKTDLPNDQLIQRLNELLRDSGGIRVFRIHEVSPGYNPDKAGVATLAEYLP